MRAMHPVAPCVGPRLAEQVLDGARRGGALSDELMAHIDLCEHCRGAVEQARRVAEAWTTLEADRAELQRAGARFFAARTRRRPKMAPAGLALAVLLVAAVASAAVRVGMTYFRSGPSRVVAHGATAEGRGFVAPPAAEPEAPVVVDEPRTAEEPANVAATAHPEETTRTRSHAHGPETLAQKPVTPTEPRPTPADKKAASDASETARAWAAAADAMRADDYTRAEAAFAELAQAGDAHTRDAARLARAQVWAAQGRVADARIELEDLATNGATAGLRNRAAAAIERLR